MIAEEARTNGTPPTTEPAIRTIVMAAEIKTGAPARTERAAKSTHVLNGILCRARRPAPTFGTGHGTSGTAEDSCSSRKSSAGRPNIQASNPSTDDGAGLDSARSLVRGSRGGIFGLGSDLLLGGS